MAIELSHTFTTPITFLPRASDSARDASDGSWPYGSRLELGGIGGVAKAESSRLGSMNFHTIKSSKVARMWGLVLAAGLAAGLFGVWENGWQTGDTVGLIVWFILFFGVLSVVGREKRMS
jgi:hypothetical protein